MSPILAVTAIDLEARGLARRLGLEPVHDRRWPWYRSRSLEVVCAGLRAARLAEIGARCADACLVVSAGTCGALAPSLAIGALVVPEAVLTEHGERLRADRFHGIPATGTLLTTEEMVATPAAKSRLWLETGATAVDMESAAILRWARASGRRAAVVRAVSDTADDDVPADLARVVDSDGRVRPLAALRTVLARPSTIPRAVTLRRGTDAALDSVAAALAHLARSGRLNAVG